MFVYISNHNPAKMAHHSDIFIRAKHLKCSHLENKAIFSSMEMNKF